VDQSLAEVSRLLYFHVMTNANDREEFFKSLAHDNQIIRVFDLLPEIAFYLKDRKSRFVALNRKTCEYLGVSREEDALGKTDMDFFPKDRADVFLLDDLEVIQSGQPIENRIQPHPHEEIERVIVTSKIPLRNQKDEVIGLAGFSRELERLRGGSGSADQFAEALEHLKKNFNTPVNTSELAKIAGMSVSQFERRFRRGLGSSPRQYLLRFRVDSAARLLTFTNWSIARISEECGFHDHAHFTRSFKKMMNMTPLNFRKRQKGE